MKIENETAIIYNGDVLEKFKFIEDNSINLILIDPPYNINVKNKSWDKWKKESAYIDFMGEVFQECQRVLKDNGTMYWFHNDFNQYTKLHNYLIENTEFKFNSKITWVKPNFRALGWKNPSDKNNLRSWFNITEEIFYYTFEDGTGLDKINKDINNYKSLREYFKNIQGNKSKKEFIYKIGDKVDHTLRHSSSQWNLPTEETYNELIEHFNIDKLDFFKTYKELKQEYDNYRKQYEELRQEYEELRYTFDKSKETEPTNIWYSESKINSGVLHPTQKPLDILERIIKTSSKEGDIVLDCFMGTGSTGVACNNLNRKFIGIERDEEYFGYCVDRIINKLNEKEIKEKIKNKNKEKEV